MNHINDSYTQYHKASRKLIFKLKIKKKLIALNSDLNIKLLNDERLSKVLKRFDRKDQQIY